MFENSSYILKHFNISLITSKKCVSLSKFISSDIGGLVMDLRELSNDTRSVYLLDNV